MAIKQTDGVSFLTSSTITLPTTTSDFTVFLQFKLVSPPPATTRTIFALFAGADDYNDSYIWLGVLSASNDVILEGHLDGGSYEDTAAAALTADTWYPAAVTYDSALTTLELWVDGVFQGSISTDFTSTAEVFTTVDLLSDSGSGIANADMSVSTFRGWQALLTKEEIVGEATRATAVRVADLLWDYSLDDVADLADDAGLDVDLTIVGSPTTDTSPTYTGCAACPPDFPTASSTV